MFIDLNSDVGESYGNYIYGNDAENMAYLSSVNIACGLHAGDPLVMRETVALAIQRNIAIGAHPGFPDRQGFGRRKMDLRPQEAKNYVIYQIAALDGFVRIAGKKLTHVALHGALSVVAKSDREIAAAVMEGIREYDPGLVFPGMPGLASYETA
ncbi:MAG: LamB/YcsF family protein, partial [Desulfobacterales bacterium]